MLEKARLYREAYGLRPSLPHFFESANSARKALQYQRAQRRFLESAINQSQIEALRKSGVKGFYHNAASPDVHPGRFEKALSDPTIKSVEIDVLSFKGRLLAGHGRASFERFAKLYPEAMHEQDLRKNVARAIEYGKDPHFDVKIRRGNLSNLPELRNVIEEVPEDLDVFMSGLDWKVISHLFQTIKRPITALYTIDGYNGNSWGSFRNNIMNSADQTGSHKIGASIKSALVTPRMINTLNDNGMYSLAFCIDNASEAVRFAHMGVSGITSNNYALLEVIA